jgi:hypothetical protein
MGHLQPVADRILAGVAIQRHYEAAAVLVAELKGYVANVEAAFDEHRRARVAQLVEVDRTATSSHPSGTYVAPEVGERALR